MLNGPARVPGRGTMVIGVDAVGAVIGLCQPARPQTLGRVGPGSLYWAQLDTWDGPGADAFYAALFGYQQHQIGDGVDVDYTTWSWHGHPILGRLRMHLDWAHPKASSHDSVPGEGTTVSDDGP